MMTPIFKAKDNSEWHWNERRAEMVRVSSSEVPSPELVMRRALEPFANIPIPPGAKLHWPINYSPVTARYSDILAARQALSASPVMGEWVLVPREPTKEMIEAVEFAIYRHADCDARSSERGAPYAYRAMIEAASLLSVQRGGGSVSQSQPCGAEKEPLPPDAAALVEALRSIAFLRPGGPTRNKLAMQMERIAIDAMDDYARAVKA